LRSDRFGWSYATRIIQLLESVEDPSVALTQSGARRAERSHAVFPEQPSGNDCVVRSNAVLPRGPEGGQPRVVPGAASTASSLLSWADPMVGGWRERLRRRGQPARAADWQ
jgi:hypothetical protein